MSTFFIFIRLCVGGGGRGVHVLVLQTGVLFLSGFPLHRKYKENGQQNSLSGKTGNLEIWNLSKQKKLICKFPDPLGKRYCDICASLSFRSWICLPSEFCVCINIVTNHVKLTQVKFAVRQGNVENLKLQFEWGPCFIYCAPIFTQ